MHHYPYTISSRNELLRKAKEINVPLYGSVNITMIAQQFIDSKYFQRLKDLMQLGACREIFIGAVHTRFEHSIGTYYLADCIVTQIKNSTDECRLETWLNKIDWIQDHYKSSDSMGQGFNPWLRELVKIAALCHDLGHGPYSHLFDDEFIQSSVLRDHPNAYHESRSCFLMSLIIKESVFLSQFITESDLKLMCSLIDPPKTAKGFIYQIVSNTLNDMDIDKYDYLNRDPYHLGLKTGFDYRRLVDSVIVIDNNIAYPEQSKHDIIAMFTLRHTLHRRVYGHKGVVSAQFMRNGIMKIVDKAIGLTDSITDMEKFRVMTDTYIMSVARMILQFYKTPINPYDKILSQQDYSDLENLMYRIDTHSMYHHIGTIVTKFRFDISEEFKDRVFIVYKNKVGFVSGNKKNPLDNIYVYKTKEHTINGKNVSARKIDKTEITHLLPDIYQEFVTMVYSTSLDRIILANAKEKFRQIEIRVNEE
jgi:HD superfamily phosphohydrolase